jgi:hypothetical protein
MAQQVRLVHRNTILEMRPLDLADQHAVGGNCALGVLAGSGADQAGTGNRALAVGAGGRADQHGAMHVIGVIQDCEQLTAAARGSHVVMLFQIRRCSLALFAVCAHDREWACAWGHVHCSPRV